MRRASDRRAAGAAARRAGPLLLLGVGAVAAAVAAVNATHAAFSATTTNPASTFDAAATWDRIPAGERSTSAWRVGDAADGSESDESYDIAYTDSVFLKTKSWTAAAWSSDRYLELPFNDALPAGLPVTAMSFRLGYADDNGGGGEYFCFYFEVRRASTAAVLAVYGSPASPVGCTYGNAIVDSSTPIPAVTSTDVANDLAIRVYGFHSNGQAARVDHAVVEGQLYGRAFTLYPLDRTDRADGVSAAGAWGPAVAADGAAYQAVGNWSNAFAAGRFLKLTFPGYLPTASVVTSARLEHGYRSATAGDTTCWYAEIYDGATLIGAHGSAVAPISCNATTAYATDTVALPEVDTAAEANNLSVKVYARNSGGRRSQHDLVRLRVNYSLGPSGCVDPRTETLVASGDSWVDENAPNATAGGDADLKVRSRSGDQNRRALVTFTLPQLGDGCAVTAATLRLFANSVQGTRTLEAYRAASAWSPAGVTWANQPATTGAAATAANAAGWRTWNVTSHVQAMYAGSNFGFVVKDADEQSATSYENKFDSSENANTPELSVTIG